MLSADQLVEHVWGHAGGVSRDQVKLYVSYLRKKLGQEEDGFEPIQTVRGFGYRYVPPSADERGRVTLTRVPLRSRCSREIVPPWPSTIARAMTRPSPVPGMASRLALEAR